MKFKSNHYYCVIHRDFATINPVKCLIKVGDCYCYEHQTKKAWDVHIIKVFEKCENNISVKDDATISWFEDWCEILKEFKNYPSHSELLAVVL